MEWVLGKDGGDNPGISEEERLERASSERYPGHEYGGYLNRLTVATVYRSVRLRTSSLGDVLMYNWQMIPDNDREQQSHHVSLSS